MKTIAASLLALGLFAGAAAAQSSVFDDLARTSPKGIFDQINETSPKSFFEQLNETSPRSIFDEIRDTSPRSGVFGTIDANTP